MFQDLTSMVLDIGTAKTRVGYGGDDAPKMVVNSYVSKFTDNMEQEGEHKYKIGDKFLYNERPDNQIESIFHKKGNEGYQYDYERMEEFVEHLLCKDLNVNVSDYSFLLSEDVAAKPHEMREIRERMAEFLFQKLNVSNIFFLKSPVLSCFATGRSTAMILDSGENFTRAVSVHDGYCLYKSAKCVPYGGKQLSREINNQLQRRINGKFQSKYSLSHNKHTESFLEFHHNELLADIKESLSVKRSEESTQVASSTIEYELPDKRLIILDRAEIKDKFLTSQLETFNNYNYKGVPQMITDSVNYCDVDIKKELYANILMSGGNVLYGTLIEDVLSKISENAPPNVKVKSVSVCSPNERKYLSWIGGSIVTSLSSFQSYWVGRQEWKEAGPTIIEKKCT